MYIYVQFVFLMIELIEFAPAKFILYSLKKTNNPKLILKRVMPYFVVHNWYLLDYTLLLIKPVCTHLPQSSLAWWLRLATQSKSYK